MIDFYDLIEKELIFSGFENWSSKEFIIYMEGRGFNPEQIKEFLRELNFFMFNNDENSFFGNLEEEIKKTCEFSISENEKSKMIEKFIEYLDSQGEFAYEYITEDEDSMEYEYLLPGSNFNGHFCEDEEIQEYIDKHNLNEDQILDIISEIYSRAELSITTSQGYYGEFNATGYCLGSVGPFKEEENQIDFCLDEKFYENVTFRQFFNLLTEKDISEIDQEAEYYISESELKSLMGINKKESFKHLWQCIDVDHLMIYYYVESETFF